MGPVREQAATVREQMGSTGEDTKGHRRGMNVGVSQDRDGEEEPQAMLPAGTHVEVRNRYLGTWARGFEVVASVDGTYEVRISDSSVMPDVFKPEDVRPSRRRQGLWWA